MRLKTGFLISNYHHRCFFVIVRGAVQAGKPLAANGDDLSRFVISNRDGFFDTIDLGVGWL